MIYKHITLKLDKGDHYLVKFKQIAMLWFGASTEFGFVVAENDSAQVSPGAQCCSAKPPTGLLTPVGAIRKPCRWLRTPTEVNQKP